VAEDQIAEEEIAQTIAVQTAEIVETEIAILPAILLVKAETIASQKKEKASLVSCNHTSPLFTR